MSSTVIFGGRGVNFLTRDYAEENTAEVSFGTFNTQRYLRLLSPTKGAV